MPIDYTGQRVAVLGLGRSGEAAARLLLEAGATVTVLDSGDPSAKSSTAEMLSSRGAQVILGGEALGYPQKFDFAVLSPGIDPLVPLARRPVEAGIPLLGEIELAFRNCRCAVVAITGTNGKTTTTALTEQILQAAGIKAEACGNIGLPFSEVATRSGKLDAAVVEISSFQLETVDTFHPRVAVWTNFSANHLDRYPDLESYRAAKLRIFNNQTDDDFAVINAASELPPLRARRVTFSATLKIADFQLREDGMITFLDAPLINMRETRLRGPHNAENLMAALAVGHCLGAKFDAMLPAAKGFVPPPHRCEFVREMDGVTWINDSKSTNLDALSQALAGQTGGVVLIAGGKNKGFSFAPVANLVASKAHDVVLIGEMRDAIAADWGAGVPCHKRDSLEEAVATALKVARPGDTVLFSPGTSSFDMFRSYEERGDFFKQLTNNIHTNHTTS